MDENTLLKLSSSFGGGMGRLREVCGAVSGMFIVAGLLYGYTDITDKNKKTEHYSLIQYLASEFEKKNGSIVCRKLLGIEGKDSPVPSERTASFYIKRPCSEYVADAVNILDNYIASKNTTTVNI
jgi:C_GCAxxG_C_C family probable redox protein